MVGQTIRVSLRQMMRRPFLPLLNLTGLALGIAVSLLILLYAYQELHYDDWVTDQGDLYRIEGQYKGNWAGYYHWYAVNALGPAVRDFPEVESVTRVFGYNWLVKKDNFVNYELIFIAEAGFFEMFPIHFVKGDRQTAFLTQNNIILSQEAALQYFGEEDPIGQTVTLDSRRDYTVSGVFQDVGTRTDYQFKFIVPFQDVLVHEPNSWNVYDAETFVRLKPGAYREDLSERLALLVDEHRPLHQQTDHVMRERFQYFLQPFSDLHLGSSGRTATNTLGNYVKIYGFIAIAVLVLIVSVFNYISLATARALEREREFCLRKISGAGFKQILQLTILESLLLTFMAACLGLVVAEAILPQAASFFGADYNSLASLLGFESILIFIVSLSLLGLVAGLYPALMIKSFKPVKFLSGSRSSRATVNRVRSAFVFFQFSICIGLVIGAVAISRQMAFLSQLNLGYDPNGMVAVYGLDKDEVAPSSDTFKERVAKVPGVVSVTRSKLIPLGSSNWFNVFYTDRMESGETVNLRMVATDYDFLDTYKANLIAGRRLSPDFSEDTIDMFDDTLLEGLTGTRNVIVNKEALSHLGYERAEDIIGQEIFIKINNHSKPLVVVGVIEGMQFDSSRSIISPKIHFHAPNRFRAASIRVDTSRTQEVIAEIEALWSEMYPDVPFQRFFLEDLIKRDHEGERKQQILFIIFSGLAILLSLIGLVGLVSNSIAHRTKEISIRRVLGASPTDNIKLLTLQYVRPVLLANIPAWAVAYYFLSDWLEKYPQRIEVGPEYYLMAGGVILVLTVILTIAIVLRTVFSRPAQVLKYE